MRDGGRVRWKRAQADPRATDQGEVEVLLDQHTKGARIGFLLGRQFVVEVVALGTLNTFRRIRCGRSWAWRKGRRA